MLNLPQPIITVLCNFAPLFSLPVFLNGMTLMVAHFLCHGKRTVTNLIRLLGEHENSKFTKYHYIFRKASWSSFLASKTLFFLIIEFFIQQSGVIEINIDTKIQRRRGAKIKGLGRHRDAVASSKSQKVLAIGHNWLVITIRVQIFGSKYKWSLPFLSYLLTPEFDLASSKNVSKKKRHKKMTKVTEQVIMLVRRWLGPNRTIIVVADSAFACRSICRTCRKYNVCFCTQLRLNASLYDFPPEQIGKHRGRPRVVGNRLPSLETMSKRPQKEWEKAFVKWYGGKEKMLYVLTGTCLWYHNSVGGVPIRWVLTKDPSNNKLFALLTTDYSINASKVIELFIGRWTIETTFQELNKHLGFETIHTWSETSINRSAPIIIASYSIACLAVAKYKEDGGKILSEKTAWYKKNTITFSDIMYTLKSLTIKEKFFPQNGKNGSREKMRFEEVIRLVGYV
jgi:hypothetical protein